MSIYELCKKVIASGKTNNFTAELDTFYLAGKLTKEEYTELTENNPENTLKIQKEKKVSESKTILATYLENHPLQWTDGKYYSVTSEKQSLLTSNLALYQISVATAQPFKLTWNSTGAECVEQTYENLAALALEIGVYVKPFVSHQQELELSIKECNTLEQLNAIKIEYDSVAQVVRS